MRNYRPNSEEAISRILAAALLADGALDKSEIELLESKQLVAQLGVSGPCLDHVTRDFCEDLIQYGQVTSAGHLELSREAINQILDEIQDVELQKRLLAAILDITFADHNLSHGEVDLASQAMLRWIVSPDHIGYELHPFSPRWPKHFNRASMGSRI